MAKGEATLRIVLEDLATKGITGVKGALSQLRQSWLAASAAVAGFTAFMVSSLNAYAEQEKAISALNVALKNQGIFTEKTSRDLVNYATQLQNTTTFSDEAIIETERLLVTFGQTGTQLKDTTKAALDLSTGLGIDLRSATLILGKAFKGETATLSRYGITLKEGLPETEKFAAVMDQINRRFGGAAQAAAGTYAGKIEQLKNRFSDLKEKIGAEALPVADFWLRLIDKGVSKLEKAIEVETTGLKGRELTILALKKQASETALLAIAEGNATSEKLNGILLRIAAEEALLAKEQEIKASREELAGGPEAELEGLTPEDANRLNSFIFTTEQIKLFEAQAFADRLREKGLHHAADQVLERAQTTFSAEQSKQRFAAGREALNALASLQNSKSKTMATVGKAAAITLATIDTYRGATGAFAALSGIPFVGPVLAFAAAAAIVAAGLANVARISGTPLAEGGVVPSTAGGMLARVAEGGSAEAVIPLEDERAQEKIRAAMGGNGPTINIYAGTVVADQMSMETFAKRIDEEIFRLARNRESLILSPGGVTGA